MKLSIVPALVAGMCFAFATPSVNASEWNQRTLFTFSQPVEIPGHVLSAGTYTFKLADSLSDRDVVEVYDKYQKHLYGMFLVIPDYRLKTPTKPIMTFAERAAGSPEAVEAWFYPGDNYGHEFVYPKSKAMQLAKANNEPVASMSEQEFHSSSMKQGHIKAVKPSGKEVSTTEAFGSPRQTTSHTSGQTSGNQAGNR